MVYAYHKRLTAIIFNTIAERYSWLNYEEAWHGDAYMHWLCDSMITSVLLKLYIAWLACIYGHSVHDKLWKLPKINLLPQISHHLMDCDPCTAYTSWIITACCTEIANKVECYFSPVRGECSFHYLTACMWSIGLTFSKKKIMINMIC